MSLKGLADFPSGKEWKEELFRHAVEVCRILCPDYWSKNRNLFSVGSKTPEDLAQTIMEQVWTRRYGVYIQREIEAAAAGGLVVVHPATPATPGRPATDDEPAIPAVAAVPAVTINPWDRTIMSFRKQFYFAARSSCKIQNRHCRAGKRYNEECWAVGLDETDDRHFGFLEPECNDVTFSDMESRVLAMSMAPNGRGLSFARIEREFIADGLNSADVRAAVRSVKSFIAGAAGRTSASIKDKLITTDPFMTTDPTTTTVKASAPSWTKAYKEALQLIPLTPETRHAAFLGLTCGDPQRRAAATNRIVSGMMSSLIGAAMHISASSRWDVKRFAVAAVKNMKVTVRDWCRDHDSYAGRVKEVEAEVMERLEKDDGKLPSRESIDARFADFTRRYNEFSTKAAGGELSNEELERERALESEREVLVDAREMVQDRERMVRIGVKAYKVAAPTEDGLFNALMKCAEKTIHSPGPGDLLENREPGNTMEELREIADDARGRGLLPTKPKSALIAELVAGWPSGMQDALYDSLLADPAPDPQGVVDRINNIKLNARGLLQADYRVLSEYFKVELNAASNPMVALRAIDHRIREQPALGESLPGYVNKVLDALRDVCLNGGRGADGDMVSLEQVINSVPRSAEKASALSTMYAANVCLRAGTTDTFEIMPVKCPVQGVWAELQERREWKFWLESLQIDARFEPKDGDMEKRGGKIVISGAALAGLSQMMVQLTFKGIVKAINFSS